MNVLIINQLITILKRLNLQHYYLVETTQMLIYQHKIIIQQVEMGEMLCSLMEWIIFVLQWMEIQLRKYQIHSYLKNHKFQRNNRAI